MEAVVRARSVMTFAVRAYIDRLRYDPPRTDLRVTDCGRVLGLFAGSEIDSVFQPVYRLAATEPARAAVPSGVHAMARLHGSEGAGPSSGTLFALAARGEDLVLLDRLCRMVHTLNFFAAEPPALDLLLNVHPRLLATVAVAHGQAFRRVLDSLAVQPQTVTIVLPPLQADDLALHAQALASYRLNGFRTAVTLDDPALLRLLLARQAVDTVRVQARLLAAAGWAGALAEARAAGAQVLVTRIEDNAQLALARRHGTHGQGRRLGEAATVLPGRRQPELL
jgi:EAL domain-containing protein (putative c-di-GMP-specific phosphodiesterase class I)